ncbi:MAG: starch-binding protein, partial [Tannerella sp.]|nr:starch-binding protein [Tannerella sp.]
MKNLFLKTGIAICLFSIFSTNLFSFTVKWKVSEGSWSNMYIYAWNLADDTPIFGSWPGIMVTADGEGWYSATISDGITAGIKFNSNNGPALPDIKPVSSDVCYSINLNNLSFVQIDCNTGEPYLTPSYTIKWKVTVGAENWSNMYVYAYGGSPNDIFGGWPGVEVFADAAGWYAITVPEGQTAGHVMFNSNSEGGFDIVITEESCFEINLDDKSYEYVDCSTIGTGVKNVNPQQTIGYFDSVSGQLQVLTAGEITQIAVFNLTGSKV